MIVRPGPGLRFTQLHPVGWPPLPMDAGLVAAVVPLYRAREVAVVSFVEALQLLTVTNEEAVITESITGYVGALAVGDLTPVHPPAPGPRVTYLQSRRMIAYDCDAHTHREWRLLHGDENAEYAMWLGGEARRVAVQVEDTSQYDDGGKVITRVDVFDVSGPVRRIRGRALDRVQERGFGWAAGADVVAHAVAGGLAVFDADHEPVSGHPLADAARRVLTETGADRIHALRIHPARPLAVLSVRTVDNAGLRSFATYRVAWSGGEPEVRALAEFSAIDGLALGAFAPVGEALDVRASTSGATRLVILDAAADTAHDLGIARDLQGACWSTAPLQYLAFDRAAPEILIWSVPGGRP